MYLFLIFSLVFSLPSKAFQKPDSVTLSLGWYPQFQFAGYYAALEKGYYADEGLEVIIKTHEENRSSVDAVISQTTQYGIGTGSMLLGHKKVNDLVVLAAFQQQSPVVLITLDNGRFEKLKDFEGRLVHGGTEVKAMFMSAGVQIDSIGSPLDIPEIVRLQRGEYDAMTMYVTDLPILRQRSDSTFKIFKPINYGINFYGESLFTSREELQDCPDRVAGMIEASRKGWEYALSHKEEMANLLVNKYGSSFTKEQLLEEAALVEESLIIPTLFPIGSIEKNKWAEMSKTLSTLGILTTPVDLDNFIYKKPEDSWGPFVRTTLIFLSIVTSFLIIGAGALIIFNMRLREEVKKGTDKLKNTMERLNLSLEKEKHITDNLEKLVKERTRIIAEQNVKLEEVNSELESRVQERTMNLQKTNRELDMFIYSMSHDIRAPLASIQGLINVIAIHPEEKDRYIELIEQNVKQLDFFIEEILEYTRNTKRSLNNETIELKPLVDSIFQALKYISGHERITPVIEVDDHARLVTDKTRLMVILRNLISNAIKYQDMQKKDPFVRVIAKQDHDKVIVTVEDNGIGISNEHLEKVYDMFYRATENSKGSGLGLFIVKEILTNMKASIKVSSELHSGTSFKLEFINQAIPETIS